jgi:hypothetical protein
VAAGLIDVFDDRPVRVRVRALPASAGFQWIRSGWRAFRRQPGGFLGLLATWLLATIAFSVPLAVLSALVPPLQHAPVLLQLLCCVLLPLPTLGTMMATEAAMNDLPVRPHMLFMPLGVGPRVRRGVLLIALAYFVVFCLAYYAGNGLDNGEALAWLADPILQKSASDPPEVRPLSDMAADVLWLKAAVVALGSVPLWHAPALMLWGRQGAAHALFSSVVALWRTRAAFAVYALCGAGIGVAIVALMPAILAILTQGLVVPTIAAVAGWWVLCAVFYVTLWFGFLDTFEITPADRPPPAPDSAE